MIDRRFGPSRSLRRGQFGIIWGDKRPKQAGLFEVDRLFDRRRIADSRICSPAVDPLDKVGDDFVWKLPSGGHLGRFVAEGLDNQALVAFLGDESRPRVAPLGEPLCRFERQSTLERFRFGGVAFVAMLDQDGSDFLLEELQFGSLHVIGSKFLRQPGRAWEQESTEKAHNQAHGAMGTAQDGKHTGCGCGLRGDGCRHVGRGPEYSPS